MSFADLLSSAGLEAATLCVEANVDVETVKAWMSGTSAPPHYIIRAIETLANVSQSQTRSQRIRADDSDERARPKLVSLFAGAGGLDIGLEESGFRTVLANEIEAHACQSLRANRAISTMSPAQFARWFDDEVATQRCYRNTSQADFERLRSRLAPALTARSKPLSNADILEIDVRSLSSEQVLQSCNSRVGEIDLIAGGAPCQPFSRAGKQETVNCDDGRLFLEFVRLVDQTRPRWFLFENVKGLVQHSTESLLSTCGKCYSVRPAAFLLRTNDPQLDTAIDKCAACGQSSKVSLHWEKRRGGSLEIIEAEFARLGYACQSTVLNARDFGVPQDRERLFIVGSRDGERFHWPEPTHGSSPKAAGLFDSRDRHRHVSFRQALLGNGHWRYGTLDERAVIWVKNVVRPHDEPVTWSLDRVAPTIGAHQAAKLAIAPFGVPDAQLARQQWHTLGRRQGDTPPVFVEHEYLTDLELLKLQTFPSHWYLHGTRMERAFQIGNAVPPLLAKAVGSAIMAAMGGEHVFNDRDIDAKRYATSL